MKHWEWISNPSDRNICYTWILLNILFMFVYTVLSVYLHSEFCNCYLYIHMYQFRMYINICSYVYTCACVYFSSLLLDLPSPLHMPLEDSSFCIWVCAWFCVWVYARDGFYGFVGKYSEIIFSIYQCLSVEWIQIFYLWMTISRVPFVKYMVPTAMACKYDFIC